MQHGSNKKCYVKCGQAERPKSRRSPWGSASGMVGDETSAMFNEYLQSKMQKVLEALTEALLIHRPFAKTI
eukprot:6203382-Amphidinium_carterae.1